MEERLKGMKKRALALFMAVMLTLQMTGCSTGTKEQDTTAENKTQSSIKDLFNSGKNGKTRRRRRKMTRMILSSRRMRRTAKKRTRRYGIRTTIMNLSTKTSYQRLSLHPQMHTGTGLAS